MPGKKNRWFPRARRRTSYAARKRLGLEILEKRRLLTGYMAASAADLIADINLANAAGGTNSITLTSAGGASPLAVTFNSQACQAAILAVVQNITYKNGTSNPTIGTRTISFQLTDGLGNLGAPVTQTVSVVRAG